MNGNIAKKVAQVGGAKSVKMCGRNDETYNRNAGQLEALGVHEPSIWGMSIKQDMLRKDARDDT
jgi:hypothetical protein